MNNSIVEKEARFPKNDLVTVLHPTKADKTELGITTKTQDQSE